MNVRFICPTCEQPGRLSTPLPAEWVCPKCDQVLYLKPENAEPALTACVVCGNAELYRRKDFPQTLGVSILALCLRGVHGDLFLLPTMVDLEHPYRFGGIRLFALSVGQGRNGLLPLQRALSRSAAWPEASSV